MYIHLCSVLMSVLLMAAPLLRAQDVQILMTGKFHEDEITVQNSESWYALIPVGGSWRLVLTELLITPCKDVVNDNENQTTGKEVGISRPEKPLFLVRGIPGLKEKDVVTAFSGSRIFYPGDNAAVDSTDQSFRILATGQAEIVNGVSEVYLKKYSIYIASIIQGSEYRLLADFPHVLNCAIPCLL